MYEIYEPKSITRYMEALYEDRQEELKFTRAYIKNMYQFYGYGIWLVCLKDTDEIIGRAGISNREVDGENQLELGYVIGEEYQCQGYAFEACEAICEFAKKQLEAKELVCFMDKENLSSVRLAEKLGFQYMGEILAEEKYFAYYKKKL